MITVPRLVGLVHRFMVPGQPACKGSTVSFLSARGRPRIVTKTDSATLKAWTRDVRFSAKAAEVPLRAKGTPIGITAIFQLRYPIRRGRTLPAVRPDVDKMARALLDALTGIAYEDDGQVVRLEVCKRFGPTACTVVAVAWAPDAADLAEPAMLPSERPS